MLYSIGMTAQAFAEALGKWTFDANGDTSLKVMMVEEIKDGQFTPVKIVGQ